MVEAVLVAKLRATLIVLAHAFHLVVALVQILEANVRADLTPLATLEQLGQEMSTDSCHTQAGDDAHDDQDDQQIVEPTTIV